MKAIIVFAISFFTLVFTNSAEAKANERNLHAQVNQFLVYLLTKNEGKLAAYEVGERTFSSKGKLDSEIYDFLYKSEPAPSEWKSIIEIAKMDKLQVKLIKQDDGSIFVLFFPEKYRRSVNSDVTFLEEQWMKKYFACQFDLHGGKIKLKYNFCFADTDGPFAPEY
ncbi:hypothetical protein RF679_09580 [Undibacterium cyanobacteriorum]|uniref:Uncharacterized protein n=1 Tax=Undibacterium cyanobacteriorum TaxID=3073561 RepID=A0ABY9RCG0_9BURK|nr:hypothetical protein [Undibacterium sp. 20NA77.5]WMW78917.1 hypothetical protein RF679_09580 [Undibacterium sp. 20NA77.5]